MYTIGKNQLLQHAHALYIQHSPQKNIYLNSSHSFLGYTGGFYSAEQTQKSENVSLNMLNWIRKSTALRLHQYWVHIWIVWMLSTTPNGIITFLRQN